MVVSIDGRRRWLLAALLASCVLATVAAPGEGKVAKGARGPGSLDRGFSGDGKLTIDFPRDDHGTASPQYALTYEFAPGRIAMASAGGGKLVVTSSKAIVSYLGNGRPNPRFGGNGAVAIGTVGGSRFQLSDIAVDSQGRVLVAGTTKPNTEVGMTGMSVAGPIPSLATVRRYLPDGQLDQSFGKEGVLNTTLGVAPPTFEGKAFEEAAVGVVGLAVDGQDRPVLTGTAVAEVGICASSQSRYERSRAIVARLGADGAPDPSFGSGGLQTIGGLSWLASPIPTATGVISMGANFDRCPPENPAFPSVVASLGDGGPNQAFTGTGFWSRPYVRVSDLAVAPSGKLVLLARTIELSRGRWIESKGKVMRLRTDGSVDTGFGRGGSTEVPVKRGYLSAIAVDAKGRVLLLGSAQTKERRNEPRERLVLIRTTATGKLDRRFGRGGRATTGFGADTALQVTDVLAWPKGRIVAGAKLWGPNTPTDNAFAVARYRGGR